MLSTRIIPCLDVREGRVVKGVRFQNLKDSGDPASMASAYQLQGADELVVLDVSATRKGRGHQVETLRLIRAELSIPLCAGGGVRSADDARALLEAGADKVAMNSAAVLRPNLVAEIASKFGRQCTVLAVDAARTPSGTWQVVISGGSKRMDLDAIEWISQAVDLGAGELLLTSWDQDGTRAGYDLELVQAVRAAVSVPIIASGGANSAAHMADAVNAGADAVLAASIFHENNTTVRSIKRQLSALGVEVRP